MGRGETACAAWGVKRVKSRVAGVAAASRLGGEHVKMGSWRVLDGQAPGSFLSPERVWALP